MRGAVQYAEGGIELRIKHLKAVEAGLAARTHALQHREEAVTQQEAALAALMPRLQAVARMESAMASIIPHLKVCTPSGRQIGLVLSYSNYFQHTPNSLLCNILY